MKTLAEAFREFQYPTPPSAVFDEDVIRHYQAHLHQRRQVRPSEEYRDATEQEWTEFEEHFDRRKVELGSCAHAYGTPCKHEPACIRCPMLHVNPKMLARLTEQEADLLQRRTQAEAEGWIGELEGIDLTLTFLRAKRDETKRNAEPSDQPSTSASPHVAVRRSPNDVPQTDATKQRAVGNRRNSLTSRYVAAVAWGSRAKAPT